MPGINDTPEQVQPIVDRAREAGANFLGGVALHLRGEVRDVFFGWLKEKRPDLLPRYEKLYDGGRGYMRPSDRARTTKVVRAGVEAAPRGRDGEIAVGSRQARRSQRGGESEPARPRLRRSRLKPPPRIPCSDPSPNAGVGGRGASPTGGYSNRRNQ